MEEEKTAGRKEPEEKMKATVFVHPNTGKEKFIFILMLIVVLCSIVPVINLVNKPVIVLGMPLMMTWSIGIVLASFVILQLARKWKVY